MTRQSLETARTLLLIEQRNLQGANDYFYSRIEKFPGSFEKTRKELQRVNTAIEEINSELSEIGRSEGEGAEENG